MKRATVFLLIAMSVPLIFLSVSCAKTKSTSKTVPAKKHAVIKSSPITKPLGLNKIFFMSARDSSDQIYSINPDGTGLKKITDESDGILKQGFDVSKDGTKIVFYGPRGDYSAQPEILAANVDGSGFRSLGNGQDALWSPDGKKLVFLGTNENDSVTPVNIMNEDGTNRREIASDGFAPLWSTAGNNLVYYRLIDIADSKGTARVATLSGELVYDFGVSYPKNFGWAFSPDDKKLIYYTWDKKSLRIGDLSNGKTVTTIVEDVYALPPIWSPDGLAICYQVFASQPSRIEEDGIWLYDTKKGENRHLLKWYSSYSKIFTWSPDSSMIAISGDPNPSISTDKALPADSNIWLLSKTGALTRLTDTGQDYSPIWR